MQGARHKDYDGALSKRTPSMHFGLHWVTNAVVLFFCSRGAKKQTNKQTLLTLPRWSQGVFVTKEQMRERECQVEKKKMAGDTTPPVNTPGRPRTPPHRDRQRAESDTFVPPTAATDWL